MSTTTMRGRRFFAAVLSLGIACLSACGSQQPDNQTTDTVVRQTEEKTAENVSLERINNKVSLQIPAESQVSVMEKEKALWWWAAEEDEDEEAVEFAVTDFDQDGYLEVLVRQDKQGNTILFEVNEQGNELNRCDVSDKVFHTFMDNPLCAYHESSSDTWYLGEEASAKETQGMKKCYMQFEFIRLYSDENDSFTVDLLDSWEEFAVYDALDVSGWENKITEEEKIQIRRIAETMKNFGTVDDYSLGAYNFDYAVCDLNQDSVLDVLVSYHSGSGIVRENYHCYAVDEEVGVKVVMDEAEKISHPEKYGVPTGFVTGGIRAGGLSVYQNEESGEIYYGFEASEDYGSSEKSYKMQWDGARLMSHPMQDEDIQGADRQGEASLRWVERHAAACSDYQYENALASYLGWDIQWKK